MVPWHTAHVRWPHYFTNCTLLGITHDFERPLHGMGLDLWNGRGPGLSGILRSRPVLSNAGNGRRKLLAKTQANYGVAGQGYNTLTGFPNSFSGGGVDPGFVGNAVFQVTPTVGQPQVTPVSKLPQGSCSTSFSSSTYSTASQLYSSSSTSISASANYEGASFSANYNYNTMTQQSSTAQQSSFILNGQSSLGGYSINAAAGVLSPYYVTAVQNLCGAYSSGGANSAMFQSQLQTFAESYGSSYIKTFYYGGYAASVLQMSSYSYSSLQSQSISLSAAASVTFIQSGGSVSGSYTGDSSVGSQVQSVSSTFQYIQIPSSTLVALTSSGNIDCTAWTSNLNQSVSQGILSPMSYTIGSQQNILLGYPYLFGSPCTTGILTNVASAMQAYFSSCQNSQVGCPPPGVCPVGTYAYVTNQTSGAYTCVYCNDQSNVALSPMCNIQHTASCGYQQCNCVSGYTSASLCNSATNPTPGGTCSSSFTGYGCSNTSMSVNQCTSGSNPVITYCECFLTSISNYYFFEAQSCDEHRVACAVNPIFSSDCNCAGSTNQLCSCQCCTSSGCATTAASCPAPPNPPTPSSSCFPADATVTAKTALETTPERKRMDQLRIGDRVLSVRPDGTAFYDSIYMFGHKDSNSLGRFVRLETSKGTVLRLTADHYVFVLRKGNMLEVPAADAVVGDMLRVLVPKSQHSSLEPIVAMSSIVDRGLFNPYTLGGAIAVDGVVASTHSSSALDWVFRWLGMSIPDGYQTLFAPIRGAYWMLGHERMASLEWIIDAGADLMNSGAGPYPLSVIAYVAMLGATAVAVTRWI